LEWGYGIGKIGKEAGVEGVGWYDGIGVV